MARPPRVHFRGAVYHVTTRAVEGIPVFADEETKRYFLTILMQVQAELPFTLHVFCIMSNHVHLVISVQDVPLARIMHRILTLFAMRYNHSHARMGHVFQSRYTVRLCHDDAYLMALLRYVHLNPVKAGLVERPGDWPWSSHRDYLEERPGSLVDTTLGLSIFHADPARARRLYREFVEGFSGPIEPPPEDEGPSPVPPALVAAAAPTAPATLEALSERVCAATGIPLEHLRGGSKYRPIAQTRKRLILEALRQGHRSADIAAHLGRSSAWIAKVHAEMTGGKLN